MTASLSLAPRRVLWSHPEWWIGGLAVAAWVAMLRVQIGDLRGPGGHHDHSAPLRAVGPWLVMVLAMMVPLVLPSLRHVALSSMWRRRHRTMLTFLAGYLLVWAVAGLVVLEAAHALGPIVAASAVVWYFNERRRRALVRCRRTMPIALRGWRADRDAARYGATIGTTCVLTCWALMAALVVLPYHLVLMPLAFVLLFAERVRVR
jgi:predicted metal-binding membrane protein